MDEIEAPGRDVVTAAKRMSAKAFRDEGYLQELNRLFLHPLGLALGIRPTSVEDALGGAFIAEIYDAREDPEGVVFVGFEGEPHAAAQRRADEIADRWEHACGERQERLGFAIQPVEDFSREP